MSENFMNKTYGFVGFGLIGGSVAKAIRRRYPLCRIIAYDPDADSLRLAKKDGTINRITDTVDATLCEADLLFLCAPVRANEENLSLLAPHLKEETIVTDIGSVKGAMHQCVTALGLERQFVGGHPMAGSERTGYANASETLLENAFYCITHTDGVTLSHLTTMQELVASIGAIPLLLTAAEHDHITAAISHLPHVVSAALVNLVQISDDPADSMRQIAAGGFKDITRISSSSPVMWQQICITNKDPILAHLDHYLSILQEIRDQIAKDNADALLEFFTQAKDYRATFSEAISGPIDQTFVLYVDIADETGQLANVVSLLAQNGISIKNLSITHNREAAFGSLMLEFYEESARRNAHAVLEWNGYAVIDR